MIDLGKLLIHFYKTERTPIYMSDHGGPFGFDVHHALEVDYLIKSYGCDAIIETGTFFGDTTLYLAEMYPDLPVHSCEINSSFYEISKQRLANNSNVTLHNESSEKDLKKLNKKFNLPFIYLDAHWYNPVNFPLAKELKSIKRAIVCVGDFFIGRGSGQGFRYFDQEELFKVDYHFDKLDDNSIDIDIIEKNIKPSTPIYANNALGLNNYPLPCHQFTRRSGRAYFAIGEKQDLFNSCNFFMTPTY